MSLRGADLICRYLRGADLEVICGSLRAQVTGGDLQVAGSDLSSAGATANQIQRPAFEQYRRNNNSSGQVLTPSERAVQAQQLLLALTVSLRGAGGRTV